MGNGCSVVADTNLDEVKKYFRGKINEEQRSNVCLFSIVAGCLL